MPQIVSRKDAKALGLKRYFTGVPCPRGHVSDRYVANSACAGCLSEWHDLRYPPEIEKERSRLRREKNPSAFIEYSRTYNDANREEKNLAARLRQKLSANLDKARAKNHHRRARILGNGGAYTVDDIERIYFQQRGCCAYCRDALVGKFQIDHIKPISKGGTNNPSNIQLLCDKVGGGCNQKKRDKDPIDFAQSLGMML